MIPTNRTKVALAHLERRLERAQQRGHAFLDHAVAGFLGLPLARHDAHVLWQRRGRGGGGGAASLSGAGRRRGAPALHALAAGGKGGGGE